MTITYCADRAPGVDQVIDLYHSAGLERPITDRARMATICENTPFWATAWLGEQLVGVARCLTDFRFCCYLSDLAVREEHKRQGVGKQLLALTRQHLGEECMILLLSVPAAMEYYPMSGMSAVDDGFAWQRTK